MADGYGSVVVPLGADSALDQPLRVLPVAAVSVVAGWPKCCGYTMRWWTQRQIDAGEVSA